jgi:hypothetical protein
VGFAEFPVTDNAVSQDLANDTGARKLPRVVNRETSMSFDVVLNDLRAIYQAPSGVPHSGSIHLAEDDIRRWIALMGEPRSVLYDRIAIYLARGFHSSELPFAFCDAVVNDISGVITSADENRPELFWEVYLAFDEGEYYHNNKRDEDPVEVYTRPRIARIVATLNQPNS